MDSRSIVLENIRRALGNRESEDRKDPRDKRPNEPPMALFDPETGSETTVRQFVERLQLIGGEGHILNDQEAAISVLRGLLGQKSSPKTLVPPDPALEALGVLRIISECGGLAIMANGSDASALKSADVGISFVCCGIADTGTVALWHDEANGRYATLLPPEVVLLLRRQTIYPHKRAFLTDMKRRGVDLGAEPMTWVTGPSVTADIEKVLVRGAHGPKRVIVLIY